MHWKFRTGFHEQTGVSLKEPFSGRLSGTNGQAFAHNIHPEHTPYQKVTKKKTDKRLDNMRRDGVGSGARLRSDSA
jgi:hypothetical protein